MTTEEILIGLKSAHSAILDFQLPNGNLIRRDYHITEFKNTSVKSVDCGGATNEWQELVIQLWEPPTISAEPQMTADKALGIIQKVEQSLPLFKGVEVKFEFGNGSYPMVQHSVSSIDHMKDHLVIGLSVGESECKGLSSGACGVPKEKVAMTTLGSNGESACSPGGGCC